MYNTSSEDVTHIQSIPHQPRKSASTSALVDRKEAGEIEDLCEGSKKPGSGSKTAQTPGVGGIETNSRSLQDLRDIWHNTTLSDHGSTFKHLDDSNQTSQTVEGTPSVGLDRRSDVPFNSDTTSSGTRNGQHEGSTLFRESKISIAVDVSGSTYGAGLTAEVRAIRDICSLFPISVRSDVSILPWSHYAADPITLDDLEELDPDGDTKPSVLMNDAECRYELQNSSFWCLLTDGDILEPDVRAFAQELVEYGLHGHACVVAIFGEREQSPANCNVSVGLSVFAVSPHCAFLYTDINNNETYVLQTKGCFTFLLPKGKSNPTLSKSTQWTDLPRVSYENLARIRIPQPQKVSKEEVILGDHSRLNLSKLLSSSEIDMEIANQILDNEDNVKTVALTAKLKGQTKQLRRWLDAVEKSTSEGSGLGNTIGTTQDVTSTGPFADITVESTNVESTEMTPERIQTAPRTSEAQNRNLSPVRVEKAYIPRESFRRSSWKHIRRVSVGNCISASENIGAIEFEFDNQQEDHAPPESSLPTPMQKSAERYSKSKSTTKLMTPGFLKPAFQKDFFKGQCDICDSSQNVMTLLLREPIDTTVTLNFPLPWTASQVLYPLAMGNYPETDIISSTLACDPCSYRLASKVKGASEEAITVCLPLVSFAKNRAAWLETINIATHRRFHLEDLPLIFLSIMYTKMERNLGEQKAELKFKLRSALEWACNILLREVQVKSQSDLRSSFPEYCPYELQDNFLQLFRKTYDDASFLDLLRYPLDGFIVANVALSQSVHKMAQSAQKRKRIVFLRFLYRLAEKYEDLLSEFKILALRALGVHMLECSNTTGTPSLFDLEKMRQMSMYGIESLMQGNISRGFLRRNRKAQRPRLSISVKDLLKTPLLDEETLRTFDRLGGLFNWIDGEAGHAIALFMHYLFRFETMNSTDVTSRFVKIRTTLSDKEASMLDPGSVSAKKVETLIKTLPEI